jgi:hypothetical protein
MLRQATARTAPLFAVRGTITGLQVLSRSPVALATRTLATLPSDASTEAKPNRPLSPHVSIYRFPLPALTSITNRATGGALTAGTYDLASQFFEYGGTIGILRLIDPSKTCNGRRIIINA